jgi:hypothetical protein
MLFHLERNVEYMASTNRIRLLTFQDHAHIVDKTVDNLESVNRGTADLVLCESVKPLQDRLNAVILGEKPLHKFYCIALNKVVVTTAARTRVLNRRCLSSLVTKASMEISSTMILTTISTIGGVREICVYISRRLINCSIDSSKSTSVSKLDMTPLAAWFVWIP